MMTIEDFQDDFSEYIWNYERVRIHINNDVLIIADDYMIDNDIIILIYAYHKIAYVRPEVITILSSDAI